MTVDHDRDVHPDLLTAAADVARNLVAYRNYGGSRTGAVRALRRRRPADPRDVCERVLDRAVALLERCRALVDADAEALVDAHAAGSLDYTRFDPELTLAFPEFPPGIIHGILGWALFHYHLK